MNKALMKKAGFRNAKDQGIKPRLIISICGHEKQGKTHWALTAPGPIAFFSADVGDEGVVQKFEEKDIWVMEVARVENEETDHEEEWDRFEKAYKDMLRSTDVRTIVVDTATEVWELLRMARFGRLTQVMPYQYGPVNAEFRALIREAFSWDKNLILLHKMKEIYKGNGPKATGTGEFMRAGFKDTGYLVQVNAQVYRYDDGDFCCEIEDCRHDPDLMGFELVGDMCNFQSLGAMVLPMLKPEVWE